MLKARGTCPSKIVAESHQRELPGFDDDNEASAGDG